MKLLFIVADTLRADHLSCYGYPKPTSPNIDAIAEKGVRFTNCFAHGNCTHPGFTSILTGCYPVHHRVVCHWTPVDPDPSIPMLPEVLKRSGTLTAAVDNLYNRWVETHRVYPWFKKGYDSYLYPDPEGRTQTADKVTDMVLSWLEAHSTEDFFLFVHYWDVHGPYIPPITNRKFYEGDPRDPKHRSLEIVKKCRRLWDDGQYDPGQITDMAYIVSLYDGEIHFVDEQVGRIVEKVEQLGIQDETLFALTADHGEILDEMRIVSGWPVAFAHIDLYDENLHVPLILSGGALPSGKTVPALVQHVDIASTLLDLMGAEDLPEMDGTSLLPLTRGEVTDIGTVVHMSENTYQKKRGIRGEEWKFVKNLDDLTSRPQKELYNVRYDPGERINLIDKERELGNKMEQEMDAWVRQMLQGKRDPLIELPVRTRYFPRDFYPKPK